MRTIYKYDIFIQDVFTILMPIDAEILTVQTQYGSPYFWAKVDTNAEKERRRFCLFGTGHEIPPEKDLQYIGTFQVSGGSLVFHLFEEL